jgi:hypothetical protein
MQGAGESQDGWSTLIFNMDAQKWTPSGVIANPDFQQITLSNLVQKMRQSGAFEQQIAIVNNNAIKAAPSVPAPPKSTTSSPPTTLPSKISKTTPASKPSTAASAAKTAPFPGNPSYNPTLLQYESSSDHSTTHATISLGKIMLLVRSLIATFFGGLFVTYGI